MCSGAGAAAHRLPRPAGRLGLKRENVIVCDSRASIYTGRDVPMEENKARYARETTARTLADAIAGADVFLGLSRAAC